jgi:hypothetical protein
MLERRFAMLVRLIFTLVSQLNYQSKARVYSASALHRNLRQQPS